MVSRLEPVGDLDEERDCLFLCVDLDGLYVANIDIPTSGAGILIKVWTATLDSDQKAYFIRKSETAITFRNVQ